MPPPYYIDSNVANAIYICDMNIPESVAALAIFL